MSQTIPQDLSGRTLQVGDFCIYTLNQWGGLNFGYIEEIKDVKGRYSGTTIRVKMKHADRFGNILMETSWDSLTNTKVPTDKESTSWLNYTYKERFLVTQPI